MYCGKCGQKLEEGSRFCPKCGSSVEQRSPYRDAEVELEPVKRHRVSRTMLGILLVILVICGAGGWGYYQYRVEQYQANQYYARVYKGGKWGYINLNQEEVISCRFDRAYDFSDNGTAVVGRVKGHYEDGSNKYGYALINAKGEQLTEFKYSGIDEFQENGLARVDVMVGSKDDYDWLYGYIDAEGNEVIECKYDFIGDFSSNGIACADIDGYSVFLDEFGNLAINDMYENAGEFGDNGLAPIEKNGYWGYIDEFGNIVIPCEYEWAASFGDAELACVENKRGKYGYIDSKGELLVPFEFDDAYPFSEGLAAVSKGNNYLEMKYALIDEYGNLVTSYIYDYIGGFGDVFEGLAEARIERGDSWKYGLINKEGDIVLPMEYELISSVQECADGSKYCIAYREYPITDERLQLGRPEIIDENGKVVFSYEEYEEMMAYNTYDIVYDEFIEAYGDNGWAVCGDGFYTYWFDKEGKIWIISTDYGRAGVFKKVK